MEGIKLKKHLEIAQELREGKSLTRIAKERKMDRKYIKINLKSLIKEEYITLLYGKIIGSHKGYDLRKMPERQTNRCETDITKKAKEILKKKYDCIEEVGVWLNNYNRRYTIDLYSIKNKLGIELAWSSITSKQLIRRLSIYEELFGKVICALLKDSSFRKKDRHYIYLPQKIQDAGFKVIIVDIAKPHPIYELP